MRTFLLVMGLAAACLAAEIPKNATEASVSTPAVVVPAAAPNSSLSSNSSSGVNLRPEDLLRPEINFNPVTSSEKPLAVDSLFPDIHLQHGADHQPSGISAVPAPAYVVNDTHQGGENLMEVSTKHTFIMKISSTTGKPLEGGAHPEPEPEPHPEPEPTAEPEPSSKGSTAGGAGSSTGGTGKPTLKPSSRPITSGAQSLSPALLIAALAVLFSRLC